jgi:uncharacterized protein YkwD
MLRYFRFWSILGVLAFAVFAFQNYSPVAAQDDVAALEIIEEINAWRIEEGLWPLKPNAVLTQMAIDQATFVLSQPDFPTDIHIDADGENPRERALDYEWPHYTLPGQIAIGENGANGSVGYAMNFWHESEIHRKTALNPAYREIGVAALPSDFGHFFMVVFGARPDVLPALVDPTNGNLYLPNEQFEWADDFTAMQEVTQIRLFDADGRPLSEDWLPWSDTIPVPENAGNTIFVLYSDGENEALSMVNLASDVVLLPGSTTVISVPPAEEVPPEEIREDQPPLEESTADPAAQESVVGATAVIDVDIRITYTGDTLNLINVSGEPLDMTGISLSGSGQNLPLEQFMRVADFSLVGVPNNHCIQARDSRISGDVVMPEGCSWARSLLYMNTTDLFWSAGDFTVQRGGVTLATCAFNAGICEVDVP